MNMDILPDGNNRTSSILPNAEPGESQILPSEEKCSSVMPMQTISWDGKIQLNRTIKIAAVLAGLLLAAICIWTTLTPASLRHDLTSKYWYQQEEETGTILLLSFGEETADLYMYSLFGSQYIGSAPYEVCSFRTIEMGDTKITVDIWNHTFKATPAIVTGNASELWIEGY